MARRTEVKSEAEKEIAEKPEVFAAQEAEVVSGITEKYVESVKIKPKVLKVVDSYLSADAEDLYRDFAIKWFIDNEKRMLKEGVAIPPDASDEWKINMVLSSKERGGMSAAGEMSRPAYRSIRAEMDKIGVLRTDMKKDKIPPETPFLLLNWLQKSADKKEKKALELKEKGDEDSGIEAKDTEKQVKELRLAIRVIAEKVTGESLSDRAERELEIARDTKEAYVTNGVEAKIKEIITQKNRRLMFLEWRYFMRTKPEERAEYTEAMREERMRYDKDAGPDFDLEISQEKFNKMVEGKHYTAEQANREHQLQNFLMFREGLKSVAKAKGIEMEDFYALLAAGYLPQGAFSKKSWLSKKETYIIPMPGTLSETDAPKREKTSIYSTIKKGLGFGEQGESKEISAEEYNKFLKGIRRDYIKGIREEAHKQLGEEWGGKYEAKVQELVEKRIAELAKSPELAKGGIEKAYKRAKENIIAEYIRNHASKKEPVKEASKIEQAVDEEEGALKELIRKSGVALKLGRDVKENNVAIREFLRSQGLPMPKITEKTYEDAHKKRNWVRVFLKETIKRAKELAESKAKK